MSAPVWVASALWSSGSWIARKAAAYGLAPAAQLDVRVISVGNVQAGGAGKTPIVARIANEALERGLKTCILTRGYQSEWERSGGVIAPGTDPVNPADCGDEPALLHRLVAGAWVAVGADRIRQYDEAKKRSGGKFDLVILDDGFQHRKIRKDLEVLAVTSATMGERVFRDWPGQIRRADLVVWTKGEASPGIFDQTGIQNRVKVRYAVKAACDQPLWIVCGVADPVSVVRSARASGLNVRKQIALPDHAEPDRKDMDRWLDESAADGCRLAVTGKDWVKWQAKGVPQSELIVLELELVFENGRDVWERVLWG